MRIHRSNRYTFTSAFYDFDESLITPDADSVQLVITDSEGAEVVTVPATITEDGQVVAEVNALPNLGHYLLSWTATADGNRIDNVELIELASKPYFKLSELIAWDSSANLGAVERAKLKRARDEAEDIIERNADVAFVPRSRRIEVTGDGSERILLPDVECRRVISATVDGMPIATSPLKVHSWGAVDNPMGWEGRIVINYEHGHSTPPEAIKTAAIILAQSKATISGVPSRAMSQNTDLGFIRFAIAGRDGATGIPDVDATIEQYSRRRPVVG